MVSILPSPLECAAENRRGNFGTPELRRRKEAARANPGASGPAIYAGGGGRIIHEEHGDITDQVRALIEGKIRHTQLQAAVRRRQLQLAQVNPVRRMMRHLGQVEMTLDPETYWHWVRREGIACWGDKGFRKDIMRDNPSTRTRTEKPMDRVSLAGLDRTFAGKPSAAETGILDQFGRAAAPEGVKS